MDHLSKNALNYQSVITGSWQTAERFPRLRETRRNRHRAELELLRMLRVISALGGKADMTRAGMCGLTQRDSKMTFVVQR
jgi:hypothetical protein